MHNKIKFSFLLLLFCGNISSQTFYKEIIQTNQTIDSFCSDNAISLFDFSSLNPNILETNLKVGDEVIIPKKLDLIYDETDFILHKIKRKQTLNKIADLYDVDINLIKKYNDLTSDKLDKGSLIKVPLVPLATGSIEIPNRVKHYVVKAKEGKWRVAYKYGITIDQLELINPQIGNFLKVSEKILVPNINFNKLNIIDKNYAYYKVLAKEGFYRLKIKLGVEEKIIKSLNPVLMTSELKEGMILKLPKLIDQNENLDKDQKINLTDFSKKKIALLLPFGLNNINFDSLQIAKSQLTNDKLLNLSLDFYLGSSIAVDSIASYGIPVQMNVFDTNNSSEADIYEIVNTNDLKNYDLVIGPLTAKAFNYTSKLLKNEPVWLASPLSKVNYADNVINTITEDDILFERIVSFVESDTTLNKKYIISDSDNLITSNKLKERFKNATQFYSTVNDSGVDTKSLVLDDLDSTFVDKKNIIFLETKDQGFVSNVTSILNSFVNDTVQISLYTTSSNKAFSGNNISNYNLSNLNFHYPSVNKPLDFKLYSSFIKNFSNIYNFIPNKYVIRGYDLVLDLLFRLSSDEINFNGSNFIETEHIENKFKYFKNKDSLGYRNLSTFIIKYENLELKVVD
ncbi:LysM peptidoglycan-binding domain-containing protein [Flavobacteriaceae bacterium]|nr:LysM peptidoglycan-binding domain-containing protein [Flavobacteriaceae bacterium]RZP00267.1 MAG: LysM peptidoglycan-binding domain-containing protein [Flavobacteriales bacterium]